MYDFFGIGWRLPMRADSGAGDRGGAGPAPPLAEFEKQTYDDWRAAAEQALKGAPFDKKLLTKTPEGITLKPIYDHGDLDGLPHLDGLPGIAPFARGTRALGHAAEPWEICQEVVQPLPDVAGAELAADRDRGIGAVRLVVDRATRSGVDPDAADAELVGRGGVSIATVDDLRRALEGVDLSSMTVQLDAGAAGLALGVLLLAHSKGENGLERLSGSVGLDPLGELARAGSLERPLAGTYDEMAALVEWAGVSAPLLRIVELGGQPYNDAGASAVEELAFALATGVEYLRQLTARGVDIDAAASRMGFGLAIGSVFFTEIAKLRAARLLWAQAVAAFGGGDDARRARIDARSSRWNLTVADPWVNMLRVTTESFAAVVGGADSVHASPFDSAVRLPDEFSRRVARNAQTVLLHESKLGRVVDPAGGSRFVEKLTHEIAAASWDLFREVERLGGMGAALEQDFPQQRIAATAKSRADQLGRRRSVLLGTNMYPNPAEKPLDPREPDWGAIRKARAEAVSRARESADANARDAALAAIGEASGAAMVESAIEAALAGATVGQLHDAFVGDRQARTTVEPLATHRACDMYERLRALAAGIAAERGAPPRVFLANMGPIKQHKARADFTTGFFEVGFFEVIGNDGFADPEDAARAALKSAADVAVICSTDDSYPDLVPRFMAALEPAAKRPIVILAGYPKDQVDAHRKSGVDDFIHIKADNYTVLGDLLARIGGRS
jgi:methylmalonyl-CoA mutase